MLEGLYKRRKTNRFDVLFYIVAGIFIVLALRLMSLQILSGGYYQAKAEGNRLRMVSMTAARGIMYDRNGQILVGSRPAYTISILPTGKALDEGEVAKLATLLKIKPEDITKKVNDHKYGYEPIRIANDISMDVVTSIEEHRHELPGVTIDVEPLRYYPYETMASQLFGYVGEVSEEELEELKQQDPNTLISGGTILGRSGLEKLYDSILRGTDGGKQVEVDATGRPVAEVDRKHTVPGSNIHLTIDANLQKAAEEAVKNQLEQLRAQGIPAQGAAVVAMDPNTGAILAMVSAPEFNPNWFAKGITTAQWNQLNNDKNHPFDNKVISGEYPPGSPFKIITGTAALDLKKVTPEEMIFDSGKHWLIDKRNAEGEALGWLNFNKALAKSDNVYFYEMGNRVGIEGLVKYAGYFGIGEKTGINPVGEASGNMASPAMLSEVANGGIKYRPYVVSRIDNKDGTPKEIFGPDKLGILPVPKNIMDLVREGLRDVTNEGGTAGELFKGFPIDVAGKTGTSENAHGRDHGWFVAYAPYDKPQIVVVALVEQGSFGAGSAGPIVRDILAAYFNVPVNKKSNDTNSKGNKETATGTSINKGQKPQNAVTSGQPRKD